MGRIVLLTMGLLLAGTPLVAAPTVSERMAACAGLMEASSGWALQGEDADRMARAAARWQAESAERARAEGAHYPEFLAVSLTGDAMSDWTSAGPGAANSEAFRALAQGCVAMDRELALGIYAD